MAKVGRITNQSEVSYAFDCPGCGIGHSFRVQGPPDKPRWDFNGDVDNPTFSPSLLVRWPKLGEDGRSREVRCHSFVRNGRIEFLSNCDHELAGQTVELPDPTDWAD
jgi:hypothetical protein